MKFQTENGTWYEIIKAKMIWRRLGSTPKSGSTRRSCGRLLVWPIIAVGAPAILQDEDILPGHSAHAVITSPVKQVIE